jgi:peroxiredoxin
MKESLRVVAALVAMLTCFVPAPAGAGGLEPGKQVPGFTLKDVDGKDHTLDQYLTNKLVVLMFIATECPVSNAYNERMVQLCNEYAARDVIFVGINSNKQESVDEIRDHSRENGFTFTVLKDVNNLIADKYGAQVTPEVYVIDEKGILRYHGRIDDSRDPEEIESRDLRAALDALLGGKEVPREETKAFGCTIKRVATKR